MGDLLTKLATVVGIHHHNANHANYLTTANCLSTGVTKEAEPTPAADLTADHPPSDSKGKDQRYSSAQFFFEYLVVVSLKKTKDGAYEPQITYQFPKVSDVLDQPLAVKVAL